MKLQGTSSARGLCCCLSSWQEANTLLFNFPWQGPRCRVAASPSAGPEVCPHLRQPQVGTPHHATHTHTQAHAFPGKRKQPQPPPPGSDHLKPLLYLSCPAAPSVALPHLTKGDTFYSAAAHAPIWKQNSSFHFGFCREVRLKLQSMQKILEDSAHSRRKKWRERGDMVGEGRGSPGPGKE